MQVPFVPEKKAADSFNMKTINVRFNAFLNDDNRFVNNSYEVVDIGSCKSEKEINEKLLRLSEKWKQETIGVSFQIL